MSHLKRLPEKHIGSIREIAREMGGQPRYALARALVDRLKKSDGSISMKTALDYINAALNEGILVKCGFNLLPKE